MNVLRKFLLTAMTVCVLALSASAFDVQKNDPPPPPPKEHKDIPKEPKQPPPPRNDNSNRGGHDNKRGKP